MDDLAADLKARADMDDSVKLQLYAMKLLELAGPRSVHAAGKLLRLSAGPTAGATRTSGVSPLDETVGPQAPLVAERDEKRVTELAWEEARRIVQLLDHEPADHRYLSHGQLKVDLQLLLAYLLNVNFASQPGPSRKWSCRTPSCCSAQKPF